jgi:hypothetical protein
MDKFTGRIQGSKDKVFFAFSLG